MIYNAKGKFDKSEDYLKRSLELSQEIGDKYSEGLTDKNLGKLYRNMGELDRSIQHLRNAIDISKEVGSDKLNISSKCELVNDYLEQDKVNSAYLLTEEMLEKFDEMDDPVTLIKLYRTIGMVERERGEFNRSRKFFTKAYEKSGEIDNLESKAMTLYEEGKLLIEMGKDAINNIKRARDIFEKGGFDYWYSKSKELLKEIS